MFFSLLSYSKYNEDGTDDARIGLILSTCSILGKRFIDY